MDDRGCISKVGSVCNVHIILRLLDGFYYFEITRRFFIFNIQISIAVFHCVLSEIVTTWIAVLMALPRKLRSRK